jgi:hypothetical protein
MRIAREEYSSALSLRQGWGAEMSGIAGEDLGRQRAFQTPVQRDVLVHPLQERLTQWIDRRLTARAAGQAHEWQECTITPPFAVGLRARELILDACEESPTAGARHPAGVSGPAGVPFAVGSVHMSKLAGVVAWLLLVSWATSSSAL